MHLITASNLTPLLELLYVLLVDTMQSGVSKSKSDTALELETVRKKVASTWESVLPINEAVKAAVTGKHKAEYLADLGASIKALIPQAKKDRSLSHEDVELFSAFALFFRTGSVPALNKLQRLASASSSPWVVQHLAPPVGDQGDSKAALEGLVKSLVGRKATVLTMDEGAQIKETKPDEYKSYLALRKSFNQAWKDAVVSFIRSSGSHKVNYTDVLNYLHLNGIEHFLPSGFTGLIDDRFRLYTEDGKMIEGIPNAVTFPRVTMNPTFGKKGGGDWVFRADRVNGEPGPYSYTSDYKKAASEAKFKIVKALTSNIENIRKRWFANVRKFDITDPKCVASVILEVLYEFSARIGSLGNGTADGKSTYGISTLQAKHAVVDPSGNIVLRYKGKDGVATTHKLLKSDPEMKYTVAAITQMLEGKQPKDFIFTYDKGNRKVRVNGTDVNNYFKVISGDKNAHVHKLRTLRGSKLFSDLLEEQLKKAPPKDEKQALAILKKMGEAVGKELNHVRRGAQGTKVTGTTALNSYIDPALPILLFNSWGLRIPKFLEKHNK